MWLISSLKSFRYQYPTLIQLLFATGDRDLCVVFQISKMTTFSLLWRGCEAEKSAISDMREEKKIASGSVDLQIFSRNST
jgi:hypothetical protein